MSVVSGSTCSSVSVQSTVLARLRQSVSPQRLIVSGVIWLIPRHIILPLDCFNRSGAGIVGYMIDGGGSIKAGIRAAWPLAPPTLVLGISFGVLARPQLGAAAPIVMSAVVFSGRAQFAGLSVLGAGGGIVARSRRC
jgi:hypothetical protein